MPNDHTLTNKNITFTDSATTSNFILHTPSWPTWTYATQIVNQPCIPEETVKDNCIATGYAHPRVFEYIVINVDAEPSVIVAGPTCVVAECADEAKVAAGQAVAGLPLSSIKVLVRQFV